jgi:hypothetical protein
LTKLVELTIGQKKLNFFVERIKKFVGKNTMVFMCVIIFVADGVMTKVMTLLG